MVAFKILDAFKKTDHICAAYFKVRRRVSSRGPPDLMEKDVLSSLREKLVVAESNILSVIKYDFNIVNPNKFLQEKLGAALREQNPSLAQICKLLILDIHRTGASLFYKPAYIVMAAFLMSYFLLFGTIFPRVGGANEVCPSEKVEAKLEEVHIDNFPPAYFFSLPSFKLEHLVEKIESARDRRERTRDPVSVPKDFLDWLNSVEPQINLNKVWEIVDMLNELLRETKSD